MAMTTSVTLSMMDNGVANIYNASGALIGTLTNDGTSIADASRWNQCRHLARTC